MYPARRLFLIGIAVVATLAVTLGSSLAPAEAQGAQRRVEGTLTNTDGVPLGSHQIGLVGLGASQGQTGQSATAADGTFAIEVPDGTYGLYLATSRDNECSHCGEWPIHHRSGGNHLGNTRHGTGLHPMYLPR